MLQLCRTTGVKVFLVCWNILCSPIAADAEIVWIKKEQHHKDFMCLNKLTDED